ncbi:MAG: hydroxymethylbilane synthase [Bacteroidota bacterium]
MSKKIRIGTRKSLLALWQANYVADLLQKGGHQTELVTLDTIGDKIQNVSISKIGSKGVFTEEIEDLLLNKEIDIAVHSAKDLQSTLAEPFEIIAFTEREEMNDVLVSEKPEVSLHPEATFEIGTSSTRRIALLKKYFPKIKAVPTRGNLQTRFKKMREGESDGMILAYAGIKRMGLQGLIREKINLEIFTPAVGQGTIAIEALKALDKGLKGSIKSLTNDEKTEICLKAERSFLKTIDGGCSIPVFGLAQMENRKLSISAGIISLNGKKEVRKNLSGSEEEAEALGSQIANDILNSGGRQILDAIKLNL